MSSLPLVTSYTLPTTGELPANTAKWELNPKKAVLLVHDMQRYFLAPFPFALREPLVSRCRLLRDWCTASGVPVLYTAQTGDMTEQQRGLLKDFWGPGMRVDPNDRKIDEELAPGQTHKVLAKWRYSAFFHSDLLELMRQQNRDQMIICGVYAHIGVLITAIEAFSNDIQPFLVADAVADFSAEHHRMALNYAASCCAVVTTTSEVLR